MNLKGVDRWIFEGYWTRPSDLAAYRMIYCTYLLAMWLPLGLWLQHVPRAFFNPPIGLTAIFPAFLPTGVIIALNVLLALLVSMLLVGLFTEAASVGTSIILLSIRSWEYSLGKVNSDILLVITPLVLAWSGWGDAFSLDALRRPTPVAKTLRGSWNLSLLALLIGLAMFSSGWAKVSTGWLDPATRATYGHFVHFYVTGQPSWMADLAVRLKSGWLWKLADWFTVALEIGFVFAAFSRRAMYIFMAIACFFHLGVWLLFGIVFAHNIIAYGAFVSYSTLPLVGRIDPIAKSALFRFGSARALGWGILATAFLLALIGIVIERPLTALLHVSLAKVVILSGVVFGGIYLVRLGAEKVET